MTGYCAHFCHSSQAFLGGETIFIFKHLVLLQPTQAQILIHMAFGNPLILVIPFISTWVRTRPRFQSSGFFQSARHHEVNITSGLQDQTHNPDFIVSLIRQQTAKGPQFRGSCVSIKIINQNCRSLEQFLDKRTLSLVNILSGFRVSRRSQRFFWARWSTLPFALG